MVWWIVPVGPNKGSFRTIDDYITPPPGGGGPTPFTPSGADYDALAAITTGTIRAYRFDGSSNRAATTSADGVADGGAIGYAHDWLDPDVLASAAVQTVDSQKPALATVGGVVSAIFDGDHSISNNDRLDIPFINSNAGAAVIVAYLRDDTEANQMLLQAEGWRIQAKHKNWTGPAVRIDGGTDQVAFGATSLFERWACLVVRWNRTLGLLQQWNEEAATWTQTDVGSLDWTWDDNTRSYINRSEYEPTNGYPANSAIRSVVLGDSWELTQADIQDMVDFAINGTALVATVPTYPDAPDPPVEPPTEPPTDPTEELGPTPLRTVNVSNQSELDAARTASIPGDWIVMSNGSYDFKSITRSGSEAHPIVYKAANNQGVSCSGFDEFTANDVRMWGINFGTRVRSIQGDRVWIIRAKIRTSWRSYGDFTRFWFCDITRVGNGRSIEFNGGAKSYHVYRCYFYDMHNEGVRHNFEEAVQCWFGNNSTNIPQLGVIEECLFRNVNGDNPGSGETIGIKGSFVKVLRCTNDGSAVFNVRVGHDNEFHECYVTGEARINVRDYNCRVVNCTFRNNAELTVFAGDVAPDADGGDVPAEPNAARPYAFECKLYNNDCTRAPEIGDTFSDPSLTPLPVKDTEVLGHIGTLPVVKTAHAIGTNSSSLWRNPSPYPVVKAKRLAPSDVGLYA